MQLTAFHDLGQAEVDNFQVSVGVRAREKEVLWFEITMDDVHAMAVVQGLQDLFEDSGGNLLGEELFFDDSVKELTSRAQSDRQSGIKSN